MLNIALMEQDHTISKLRHFVGSALRSNEIIGGQWRKFRRSQLLPSQTFRVVLERPAGRETVASKIHVRGWMVSLIGRPVSGRVLLGETAVANLQISEERKDVAKVLDLPADRCRVGFNQYLDWQTHCGKTVQVGFSLEVKHGSEVMVIGPLTVSRSRSPLLVHERGSYKEVWDGASTDAVYAMDSVAGIKDLDVFLQTGEVTAATIRDALEITTEDSVLEIGCGTGRIGVSLAESCKLWIGADISRSMLNYARENLKSSKNIRLVELNNCNLEEFADGCIDKLYCSTVFMHLDPWDRWNYIQEAFRVLRSKGRCYFDNLNLAGDTGWSVFAKIANFDAAERPPNVSKPSTPDELCAYLERAGFTEIKILPGPLYVGASALKPNATNEAG